MNDSQTQTASAATLSAAELAARSDRFANCRPKTSSDYRVEAKVIRPMFQAEIRRYNWLHDLPPTAFQYDACCLELALNPRPDSDVNFLNSTQHNAFMSSGSCAFIPANQKTVARLKQGEHLVVSCLFDESVFAPYVNWQWTPLELAACTNLHNQHIQNALLRISQELLHPGYQADQWLDAQFNYLLIELSRHIRATRTPLESTKGKLSNHQLRVIENYVHSADHAFPQTSWLAKQLDISPRHLARLFKTTTGQTIGDYVSEARINRAKTLLLNSSKKIKEIATDCGFISPSAFTQAFRIATGFTPKQFRASVDV